MMAKILGYFSLMLFLSLSVIDMISATKCKAGTPTLGKLTEPNLPDTECSSNGLDGKCYVMFTDYDNDNLDAWRYGCLIKGSLEEKCHKSFVANGVTNNYCCCTTPLCNDKNFAANCKGGVNSSVKSAPCYAMMIVLAAMASIVLAMVQL